MINCFSLIFLVSCHDLLWCLRLHLCLLEFISTPNLECISSLSCINVKFIIVMWMNVEVICGSVLLSYGASVFYLVVKILNRIYSLHYLLFRIKKPQSWIIHYSFFNNFLRKRDSQLLNDITVIYLVKPWHIGISCYDVTNSSIVWVIESASCETLAQWYWLLPCN